MSIPSLSPSFQDMIWFHRHQLLPQPHWDDQRLVNGSQTHSMFMEQLLDETTGTLWQQTSIQYYFYFLYVLEVFQFSINPVNTQNGCSSVYCIFSVLINSLPVTLPNFQSPQTLSHSLSFPNSFI